MKRHSKKIATAISSLAILATATAFAWSNNLIVKTIAAEPNTGGTSDIFLTFTTTPSDQPSCTATDGTTILAGPAEHVKEMTVLATSALLAGRTIQVHWNGCTYGGMWPVIDKLMLR